MPTQPVQDPSFGVQDNGYPDSTSMRIPMQTKYEAYDIARVLKEQGKIKGKPSVTKAFVFAIKDLYARMFP